MQDGKKILKMEYRDWFKNNLPSWDQSLFYVHAGDILNMHARR